MAPAAGTVAVFAGIVSADDALFFVHCDAREVAHMLVGARELVEQRRLAAVLVAGECKYHYSASPSGASSAISRASSRRSVSS